MEPAACLPICRCSASTREIRRYPVECGLPPAVPDPHWRLPGGAGKPTPLSAGTRLGPYEILSRLGAGGMGDVYRARDVELGREVAIKVSRREVASDRERHRRFEREARTASALDHPNTVVIHGADEQDALISSRQRSTPSRSGRARTRRPAWR